MITNERQYKITRARADQFRKALAEFDDRPDPDVHPVLVAAQRDAMKSQLEDLCIEIDEYESISSAETSVIPGIDLKRKKSII